MNLNDFVVLPNSKAKSIQLNARDLQELKKKTVTLTQESKEMEKKLQQLKDSMSKEKEERGNSGRLKWKSGRCGKGIALAKDVKKYTLQKLSAGNVKIQVLKDAPSQPPPRLSTIGRQTTSKTTLRGTCCVECEVKNAELVLAVGHGEEQKMGMTEEGQENADERGFATSHLREDFHEEESARSFQEVLIQHSIEKRDGSGECMNADAMRTPTRSVLVSAMATQTDLPPDRGAEGQGREGEERRVPVRVEFAENSLTYMDRLLLKKHRRLPIEAFIPSLAFGANLKSLANSNTGEETTSSPTDQEDDFRCYCASLFAVPVSRGRPVP